jgi:hypothetical protein
LQALHLVDYRYNVNYAALSPTRCIQALSRSRSLCDPCSGDYDSAPERLRDYDQSFYLTIAYDVDRYGVFSNGIFDENRYSIFSNGILDKTESISEAPSPGMFFVPGFPLLVLAAMKLDDRFAKAVECSVEANYKKRNGASARCMQHRWILFTRSF